IFMFFVSVDRSYCWVSCDAPALTDHSPKFTPAPPPHAENRESELTRSELELSVMVPDAGAANQFPGNAVVRCQNEFGSCCRPLRVSLYVRLASAKIDARLDCWYWSRVASAVSHTPGRDRCRSW